MSNSEQLRGLYQMIEESQRSRVLDCSLSDLGRMSETRLGEQGRLKLTDEQRRSYEGELVGLIAQQIDIQKLGEIRDRYMKAALKNIEADHEKKAQEFYKLVRDEFPSLPLEFVKHLRVVFRESCELRTAEEYGNRAEYYHCSRFELDEEYPTEYEMNFTLLYREDDDNPNPDVDQERSGDVTLFDASFYCQQRYDYTDDKVYFEEPEDESVELMLGSDVILGAWEISFPHLLKMSLFLFREYVGEGPSGRYLMKAILDKFSDEFDADYFETAIFDHLWGSESTGEDDDGLPLYTGGDPNHQTEIDRLAKAANITTNEAEEAEENDNEAEEENGFCAKVGAERLNQLAYIIDAFKPKKAQPDYYTN